MWRYCRASSTPETFLLRPSHPSKDLRGNDQRDYDGKDNWREALHAV
jgi:hypothetical protein